LFRSFLLSSSTASAFHDRSRETSTIDLVTVTLPPEEVIYFEVLSDLATGFSSPPEDLPRLIEAQRRELNDVASARKELQSAVYLRRARAAADAGVDAAELLKGLLATVGGRGGGSPMVAQGIVPGRAQLDAVITSLTS
jgi:hypothetical protein